MFLLPYLQACIDQVKEWPKAVRALLRRDALAVASGLRATVMLDYVPPHSATVTRLRRALSPLVDLKGFQGLSMRV